MVVPMVDLVQPGRLEAIGHSMVKRGAFSPLPVGRGRDGVKTGEVGTPDDAARPYRGLGALAFPWHSRMPQWHSRQCLGVL